MKTLTLTLGFILLSACSRAPLVEYDAAASAAFYAAWKKGAAGDEAGERAGLEEVARRYPHSRAGLRAKELCHGEGSSETSLGGMGALMVGLLAGAGYFANGAAASSLGAPTK